jgi:putative restriction endonuclease
VEGNPCLSSRMHDLSLEACFTSRRSHILPDTHPRGEPWVSNGLSFCKIHHAAFDAHIIGVRPDLVVEVRSDILEETDGPMLQHGLKDCHNQRLAILPSSRRDQPRREFLEERYEMFRAAG